MIVSYIVILSGGKRLRESGWRALSLLILLAVFVQIAAMGLVVCEFCLFKLGVSSRGNIYGSLGVLLANSMNVILQAYLFDNEDRFFVGWELDECFVYCTVSWCLGLFSATAVIVAAKTLPSERGYELIPEPHSYYD